MLRDTYADFARYYDIAMGDRGDIAELIEELIEQHAPEATSVLELAVGTGAVLEKLAANYTVTGLDSSAAMLQKARVRLPNATFLQADMSTFSIDTSFDVIFCVFDSINHLETFEQWERLFASVQKHLAPNGIFVFDMNTVHRLETLAGGETVKQHFNTDSIMEMTVTKATATTYDIEVVFYRSMLGKRQTLETITITESTFPVGRVKTAAGQHMELIESFDQTGVAASDNLDRAILVYRHRSA